VLLLVLVQVENFLLKQLNIYSILQHSEVQVYRLCVVAELSINKGTRFDLSELGTNFKAVFHGVEVVLHDLFYFRSDPVGINYANQSDVHAENYLPLFNFALSALSRSMSTDDLLDVFALQLNQILYVEQLPVLFALHFLEDL
jgi:hypothetical protein